MKWLGTSILLYVIYITSHISDFSLTEWRRQAGYNPDTVLSGNHLARIHEMLGMSLYLDDTACNPVVAPYGPNLNGWMKGITNVVACSFVPN